ncbi:response regulator [Proteobacteria bacterium 005FR1]|nr:response regulator [Proteobacteria bacterium 005FR1]
MHKPEISLFHHPTTTVFVDDSEEFLYSIALGVDRLPYRSFCNPSQGLDYVNRFTAAYDVPRRDHPPSPSASVSKLFAQVERKLNDHSRFAEPSVLVVDYSMPSMNGLDLCSQITNPNVKKVLLTGVADEKIAIDALNTELIDFYISKSETSLSHRLRNIISHLETRYFQDLFGWSRDSEVRGVLPHLYDPAFADFFEDTLENLEIVEHYPLSHPTGFCLINSYGAMHHLIMYSAEELTALLAQADFSELSDKLRDSVERRQLIPYCSTPSLPINSSQLFSPVVINGKQTWYCALVADRSRGKPQARTTFHQFLKTPASYSQEAVTVKRQ